MPIHKQVRYSAVESSPHNAWIGDSNPGGNYTSFSVSHRINSFSSENCSFCTLNAINCKFEQFAIHLLCLTDGNINWKFYILFVST